ncbi:MAG: polysaccharide deacetylase family protein [Verrucomicrobiae bacterium]|nr:polysaccharide deacetylase family protein [Verrucomicrobiae bacterium]
MTAMQVTRSLIQDFAALAGRSGTLAIFFILSVAGVGCLEKKQDGPPPEPLVDPNDVLDAEESAQAPVVDPSIPELTINKEAQVSVLGYHDFITGRSTNPMMINVDKFRSQMQALKDADIPVIGFDEFFAWRSGEKDIHDPSVMITIDDGWRSTYELAWPVLKEFDFPFSIYLYKNYVGGGGRALTVEMIKEMAAAGVEIGSHTVSHPLRKSVFAYRGKRTQAEFDEYLRVELQESKRFLEDKFGISARTFAYPGGIHTDEIVALCEKYGYQASITCNPSRTTWDTPMQEINRYIIHGNNDLNFETALSFRKFSGTNSRIIAPTGAGDSNAPGETAAPDDEPELKVTVSPAPNSLIAERRPHITADLSEVEGEILPGSIQLKLSGYGECAFDFDPEKRTVGFTPTMAIRRKITEVTLSFRRLDEEKEDIVGWQFEVDLAAEYFPKTDIGAGGK